MADEDALESAKNLSADVAADLRAVGIHDLRELRAIGAAEAWERLYAADLQDSLSCRLALEGAVSGRRWIRLDPDVRAACAAHVARRRMG